MFFDFKVLVLHAVEEHENIFVAVDEGVELWVQIFEHGDTDPIFLVCGCGDEEAMEELVDDAFHGEADALLVLGEGERAAGLHGFFAHLWIIIIQIVNDRLLNKVHDAHAELRKIVVSQRLYSQSDHLCQLLLCYRVFLHRKLVRLLG